MLCPEIYIRNEWNKKKTLTRQTVIQVNRLILFLPYNKRDTNTDDIRKVIPVKSDESIIAQSIQISVLAV